MEFGKVQKKHLKLNIQFWNCAEISNLHCTTLFIFCVLVSGVIFIYNWMPANPMQFAKALAVLFFCAICCISYVFFWDMKKESQIWQPCNSPNNGFKLETVFIIHGLLKSNANFIYSQWQKASVCTFFNEGYQAWLLKSRCCSDVTYYLVFLICSMHFTPSNFGVFFFQTALRRRGSRETFKDKKSLTQVCTKKHKDQFTRFFIGICDFMKNL